MKSILQRKNLENFFSGFFYVFVLIFFIRLYFLMAMTGEDIFQATQSIKSGSLINIILYVYHYLPRFGEFYQRIVIQYYTYTFNGINLDFLFRFLDAVLAFCLIYFSSWFVLGKKTCPYY